MTTAATSTSTCRYKYELRRWDLTDAPALVELLNCAEVSRWMEVPYPYTLQKASAFLETEQHVSTLPVTMAIVATNANPSADTNNDKGERILVGGIGLAVASRLDSLGVHRGELSYWIGRPWQGQGAATTAIALFANHVWRIFPRLTRIQAEVAVGNHASCRVLQKNGFVKEAVLHSYWLKRGVLYDVVLFALLKDLSGRAIHSSSPQPALAKCLLRLGYTDEQISNLLEVPPDGVDIHLALGAQPHTAVRAVLARLHESGYMFAPEDKTSVLERPVRSVFVYGTLRPDYHANDDHDNYTGDLWKVTTVGECQWQHAQVTGHKLLQDPAYTYPYAVRTDNPEDVVHGCILTWNTNDDVFYDRLQVMDLIEGHDTAHPEDSLYQRHMVNCTISVATHEQQPSYIYTQFAPEDSLRNLNSLHIVHGDWLEMLAQREAFQKEGSQLEKFLSI